MKRWQDVLCFYNLRAFDRALQHIHDTPSLCPCRPSCWQSHLSHLLPGNTLALRVSAWADARPARVGPPSSADSVGPSCDTLRALPFLTPTWSKSKRDIPKRRTLSALSGCNLHVQHCDRPLNHEESACHQAVLLHDKQSSGNSSQTCKGIHTPGIPARMTEIAQQAWKNCIERGDCCVDATAGNGSDTLWLSRAVGPAGKVYSMDLQAPFSFATGRLQLQI